MIHRRTDYRPPAFVIDQVALDVQIAEQTLVTARLSMRRAAASGTGREGDAGLRLDARALQVVSVAIDDQPLPAGAWTLDDHALHIAEVPDQFTLTTVTRLQPEANTALEGFYQSGPMYCTQCEAHGFSRITPYLDRPDVLSRFTVRLQADAARFPVLLANGNCIERGALAGGQHYARWEDPYAKPCYLFAMVAGDLAKVADTFRAADGRDIALEFFVDHGNENRVAHAMASLKDAMRWDEQRFGLVYDLDVYMIVAARAFNMGAMENKGLNIFNAAYVLATPDTATDESFEAISAVIAHEYFHNYTGNRVTCRDWFQLSLKEGLTVFRDQRFSEDHLGGAVQRIEQVRMLRAAQFPEDAGPTAHPVRPDAYQEVNNFYTATIYEKGAEVVRMLHTVIGAEAFRDGLRRYLAEQDGKAATIEDFVGALSAASGTDLSPFLAWYAQAGTPQLRLTRAWDAASRRLIIRFTQHTAPTPGQPEKQALPLPIRLRLRNGRGQVVPLPAHADALGDELIVMRGDALTLEMDTDEPLLPSVLLGFSAPVKLLADYTLDELQRIAAYESDPFVRWDTLQSLHARAHAGLMEGDRSALDALIAALQRIAAEPVDDAMLTAHLLSLPGTAWLWDQYPEVHPQRFLDAYAQLGRAIAEALCGPLSVWAPKAPTLRGQAGERALSNVALGYLARLGSASVQRMADDRVVSDNMTLAIGALRALGHHTDAAVPAEALRRFEQRWHDDALVMDRWFALRAGGAHVQAADLPALIDHPQFDWRNPNRVRAVLGSFAREALQGFHTEAGYRAYADGIARLDALNPQTAARLLKPLLGFKRLAEPWASQQKQVVIRLRAQVQSTDTRELLDAALNEGASSATP